MASGQRLCICHKCRTRKETYKCTVINFLMSVTRPLLTVPTVSVRPQAGNRLIADKPVWPHATPVAPLLPASTRSLSLCSTGPCATTWGQTGEPLENKNSAFPTNDKTFIPLLNTLLCAFDYVGHHVAKSVPHPDLLQFRGCLMIFMDLKLIG